MKNMPAPYISLCSNKNSHNVLFTKNTDFLEKVRNIVLTKSEESSAATWIKPMGDWAEPRL